MKTVIKNFEYLKNNILKVGYWLRSSKPVRFYLNKALWEDTGYPWTKLIPEQLENLLPGIENIEDSVQIAHPFQRSRGTSVELDELVAMLMISRFIKANRIIEIGTFDGNTALNFALNVDNNGEVITLDLPPPEHESRSNGNAELREADVFEKRQYVGHPVESKIRQVYGDSKTMDWSLVGEGFDFAFIDGDHTAQYVRSDTRNILSVIRPGGVVAWHDYERREVSIVIDKAANDGCPIRWLAGTRIAVGTFDNPKDSIQYFSD